MGIVSLNKSKFIEYFDCICLPELQLRDATNAARSTSYIERNIFNKRDDFDFLAINFPLIRSNIQTAPVEMMVGFMGIAFMNLVILYRVWVSKCIVFSTYFIFCSYLYSNNITSIQSGTLNNLTRLTTL